jgi:hypothetical protein
MQDPCKPTDSTTVRLKSHNSLIAHGGHVAHDSFHGIRKVIIGCTSLSSSHQQPSSWPKNLISSLRHRPYQMAFHEMLAYARTYITNDYYRAHSFLSSVGSTNGSSMRFIAKSLQRILFTAHISHSSQFPHPSCHQ